LITSTSRVEDGKPAAAANAETSIQNHSFPALSGTKPDGFSLARSKPFTLTQEGGGGARMCAS
jgi:hypothetical protein